MDDATPHDIGACELHAQAGDGHRYQLIARLPAAPRASLLWLPAMGIGAKHYVPFADALARRGIAVFLHEWRGAGSSSVRASRDTDWGYRELLTLDIPASEAMYLSFEGPQAVVALEERGKAFEELGTAAEHRLVAALDNIAAGHYPARPDTRNLCSMCAFTAVCRQVGGAPEDNG